MSRGRIVRWMLEKVGAPYRTELLEYGTSMKGEAFRAINLMGKVPALRHGDNVVTEAAAICAYLADAFPVAGLAPPPGSRLRAPFYRWLFFGAGPCRVRGDKQAMGFEVPQERKVTSGYGSLEAVLDVLESVVSGCRNLVGDVFSAADLYLGSQLGWGMMFGTIEKRPAFEAYAGRINARNAAVRARGDR